MEACPKVPETWNMGWVGVPKDVLKRLLCEDVEVNPSSEESCQSRVHSGKRLCVLQVAKLEMPSYPSLLKS